MSRVYSYFFKNYQNLYLYLLSNILTKNIGQKNHKQCILRNTKMSTKYNLNKFLFIVLFAFSCTHSPKQNILTQALNYEKKSMWRESKALFKKILKKHPGHFIATKYLGIISFHTGEYKKSILYLKKILRKSPNDFKANYYLAESYRLKKNLYW